MLLRAFILYILLIPQLFANTAGQTAEQLSAIQDAAIRYFEDYEFWPQSLDELLINGYLPSQFSPETQWGTFFVFAITGDDLVISVDIPDASTLVDLQASSNQVDVASRAVKDINASEKRFAQGDRSLAQSAAVALDDNSDGAQAFDRGELDKNSIFRDLTLTDDEIFLKSAKAGNPLSRQPNNYVRISATLRDGVVFKTDRESISFDTNMFVDGTVTAEKFIDANDLEYVIDPNALSTLNALKASTIINAEDETYILDFDDLSIFNDVQLKTLTVGNLMAKKINNDIPITLEVLGQYAITKLIAGTNLQLKNNRGNDANIGILTISTVDNPTFVGMTVNNDVNIGGNLTVGNANPIPLNSNFVLNGNDMAVEGDLSLDGNFYLQNKLIINKADGSELVIDGNSIANSKEILLQPNGDTTNNLRLSSDGTSASIDATGNNPLAFNATNFAFNNTANSSQAFRFNNSDGNSVFVVDTLNKKVGLNTTSIDSRADLDVEGTLHANTVIIEPEIDDISLKINTANPGQLINFNDSANEFGIYSSNTDPEGQVTANKGSLLINGEQGDLYIYRGTNGDNVGWNKMPNGSTDFVQGGNNFGFAGSLGSNNPFSLILETNNIPAITIDPNQNTTFHGNANFDLNDVNNINNLSVSNIQANDNTNILDITLHNDNVNAFRMRDTDGVPFIMIDTSAATGNLITQGTTTFTTNLLTADIVDINGGTIDGITAGSNVPYTSLAVASLTFTGNQIDSILDNTINFTDNNLTTSGTVTTGNIDVSNNNITNVTNIDLAAITSNTDTFTISLEPNKPIALQITDGTNDYLNIDTTTTLPTLNITQRTNFAANTVVGSGFDIDGGTIDNTIIGATTPVEATVTTLTATTLGGPLNVNNQVLSNVIINTGTINVQALTSTIATLGDISISGNTITTTANTLDIVPSTTIGGTLTAKTIDNNNGTLTNVGTLYTTNINPNNETLTVNLGDDTQALVIRDDIAPIITIDTDNNNIIIAPQFATTFNGLLTAQDVDINGGDIDIQSLISTVATLGNIRVVGNTITTTNNQAINFGATNLTTSGTVTANNLVLPDNARLDVGTILQVSTITPATQTLNITLQNNTNAFTVKDTDSTFIQINTIDNEITQGTTTFTSNLLTADNVDINGGNIEVSALTSTVATLGDLNITGNTITTTANTLNIVPSTTIIGTLTAKTIDSTNGTINNVDTLYTANINPNTDTLDINLESNTRALDIKDDNVSFITIDTTIPLITQGTTTFTSNRLTADNVDINGGTIEVSALTSTVATLGNITFSADTMRSSSGQIDFGATDLTTTGTITASALILPIGSKFGVGEVNVENITASSNTLTINLKDNESVALRITDRDQDFIIIDTDNNIITQSTTTFTSNLLTADNVDINGGNIEVSALTSTVATLGDLNITGNTITTTANTLNIVPSTTIIGTLTAKTIDSTNGTINNVDTLYTANINPNTDTLDINLESNTRALDIKDDNVSFITIDTTIPLITQGTTTFTSNRLTADNVDINGGTIEVSALTSTVATLGNITFSADTMRSSSGQIDFGGDDLTTTGTITANALVLPVDSKLSVGEVNVENITASSNTLTINLKDNESVALRITDNDQDFIIIDTDNNIITQSTTTFSSNRLTADNVDINGGDINIQALTSTVATLGGITFSNNRIISSNGRVDFGGNDISTTGNITASGIDVNGIDFTGINILNVNEIGSNTGNDLTLTLTDNLNPAFTITDSDTTFMTINTNGNQITQHATNFTGTVGINDAQITGGSISNVDINATALTVDDITIDGNQINSNNNDIRFNNSDLVDIDNLTANSIDVSGGTISNVGSLITNAINPNANLAITLNNNANAFTISEGGTNFITIDTTNDLITQATTAFTGLVSANNVNITGGSLSNVDINATALTVDQITIDSNQITASGGTIDFDDENLRTTGTVTVGGLDVNGIDLTSLNAIGVNAINPNANLAITLNNNANAFTISEGGTNFITIDTTNDLITQATTTFTGLVSANNVNITGGSLSNVDINATALTVDQITIDSNQITASGGTIDFDDENLTTLGTLTANSIDVSGGTISNVGSLITNAINPNANLAITLNNNANAFTISEGGTNFITIDTTNDLITQATTTFTGLVSANNVNITGGSLSNVDINATALTVDQITIDSNQITASGGTIDFDDENLRTTGTVTVGGLDVNGIDLTNLNAIEVNTINPNTGGTLTVTLTDNLNPALTITDGATSFITIDTTNDLITQATTTFTGLVSANNVNITGGSLSNVDINATALTVDQITIDSNQITASGGTIDFDDENLTTLGTLTANSIDVSGGTISNVGSLITNAINPNANLAITLNNNANAFTISEGGTNFITIDTTNDLITQAATIFTGNITANNNLTVNGLLTASNVDINGGTIDGATLGTNSPITELVVDNITINDSQITSDSGSISFDNENLTTTGSITAGTMITDTIRSTSNLAVNTTGNFNINTTLFVNGSNIGIGTNTPNTFLHVSGDTDSDSVATIENTSTNANARGLDIELAATTNNNARFIQFSADNTVVGAIQYQTGTFQVVNVSDRKTKTNITDTTLDAVGILSNLRVVDYHRKTNPTGSKITGFIAQEVQPIFSNMVTNVNSNLLGINETALIPVLVKGFQAQQDTLTTLTDAVEVSTESINLTKELKVNNTTVVDTNNNLFGNTLTLEDKIQTTKDKFSIKRFDNDQLSTLMTLNMAKIQDINAKGYLSVKDVYLSSLDQWVSDGISRFMVFEEAPSVSECLTSSQSGKMGIVKQTEELFICLGERGWNAVSSQAIDAQL